MLRQFRNRRKYEQATSDLNPGQTLCATLVDDQPVYFAMSIDATDDDIQRRAFELREGRTISSIERKLMSIAESRT